MGRPFFHVTRCADTVGGGFSTDYGVRHSSNSSSSIAVVMCEVTVVLCCALLCCVTHRTTAGAADLKSHHFTTLRSCRCCCGCCLDCCCCCCCCVWLQVILCHNRLSTYKEVELALAHELVHAYDFCRATNLDLTNCKHHACTEVRQNSYSSCICASLACSNLILPSCACTG